MAGQVAARRPPLRLSSPRLDVRALESGDVDKIARTMVPEDTENAARLRESLAAGIRELIGFHDSRRRFALGAFVGGERKRITACVGLSVTPQDAELFFAAESAVFRDGNIPASFFTMIAGFAFSMAKCEQLRINISVDRPWSASALEAIGFNAKTRGGKSVYTISAAKWQHGQNARAEARERDRGMVARWRRDVAAADGHIPETGAGFSEWPALPLAREAATLALVQQFEQTQWWSAERLHAHQMRQAARLVEHARRTVPFYREHFADFSPEIVTAGAEAWRALPILTRTKIQDTGEALVTETLPPGHGSMHAIRTSGSTGRPIEAKGSEITSRVFSAMQIRYHVWHRRDFSQRVAAIRSLTERLSRIEKSGKPARWVNGFPSGPMMLFDITRPIGEQLDWLIDQKAQYLLTFPSNLAALLELTERAGRKPDTLRQVVTMSEVVEPKLRDACRSNWGIPLVDSYSSEELGVIASQCPDHPHYHVMSENIIAEMLDDHGSPVAPGEVGRLVITDLHNFATPLIRYEIGDFAEAGLPCDCGRGLPVINRVLGRTRNMMTLPDGRKFWPSLPESRIVPVGPIRQFQVVQKSLQTVEVKLAVERPLEASEENALTDVLVDVFRYPFDIEYVYVDEIGRAANGKFEDFKSEIA